MKCCCDPNSFLLIYSHIFMAISVIHCKLSLYLILNVEGLQNKGAVKAQEEKMKFEKEGNMNHLPLKNNGFHHVTVASNKWHHYTKYWNWFALKNFVPWQTWKWHFVMSLLRYHLSDWQMTKANVSKRRSIVRAALSYLMHASLKNCYTVLLRGPDFKSDLKITYQTII